MQAAAFSISAGPCFPLADDDSVPAVRPLAVLAMRDDPERAALAAALRRSGFSVTTLDDQWALLDLLAGALFSAGRSQPPVLVVYDPDLPGPGVERVRERARRWFPDLELVERGTPACARLERT